MSRHPVEGDIRASLDGELPIWRRMQINLHLRGCPHCSERRDRVLFASARTSKLLATVITSTDLSESWQRVSARSNPPEGFARRVISSASGRSLVVAGAFGTALVLIGAPWSRSVGKEPILPGQVVKDVCCGDHNGDGIQNEGVLHFITENGEQSISVTYSDVDRSGTFSSGDVVHSVKRHSLGN